MRTKILFFFIFLIGLIVLPTFKTVWIDETYMAEVTYQILQGNGFASQLAEYSTNGGKIHVYGPIYFLFTLIPVKLGGLTPFSFRIINYLSYGAVLLLLLRYLNLKNKSRWTYLLAPIVFLDPSAFENAVSGRMEGLCLLFSVIAYLIYVAEKPIKHKHLLLGFVVSMAYLTTPRAILLLVPLAFYVIFDVFKKKNYIDFSKLFLAFIIPVLIWIFYTSDSIMDYVNIYIKNSNFHSGDQTAAEAYLISDLNLNIFKYVLYGLLIFSYFIPKSLSASDKKLVISFSSIAFIFIFLVKDVGTYFSYVAPLIAFTIFLNFQKSTFKFGHLALIGLACFNIGVLGLKMTFNYINPNKNYEPLVEMVEDHIPNNTRVLTNDEFYYPLREKSLDVYYLQFGKDPVSRIDYYTKHVDPEFVLTKTTDPKLKLLEKYYSVELISAYPNQESTSSLFEEFVKLGNFFRLDYKDLAIFKLQPKTK